MRGGAWAVPTLALMVAINAAAAPPATMDAKGVDEWRQANIQAEGGWVLMHADGAALTYAGGPNGVTADEDGFRHVDVRREYYKPVRLGPQPSRSNLQSWVVDCELKRLRITGMNFYAQNNMKGNGFRKSADEAGWAPVEASDMALVDRICAAAPKSQ
jgi:hypothetical protein